MQKTKTTEFRLSKIEWSIDLLVVGVSAFVLGIVIYQHIEMVEFDFFVFEALSLYKAAGDWNLFAKILAAMLYAVLTGVIYYVCINVWSLSKLASLPTALILGIIMVICSIPIIAFFLAVLAMFVGLLALFFF